jgi:hypothetical protein
VAQAPTTSWVHEKAEPELFVDTGQTTTQPRPSATVHGSGVLNEMAARAAALPDEHREEGCANPFTEVRHGDE